MTLDNGAAVQPGRSATVVPSVRKLHPASLIFSMRRGFVFSTDCPSIHLGCFLYNAASVSQAIKNKIIKTLYHSNCWGSIMYERLTHTGLIKPFFKTRVTPQINCGENWDYRRMAVGCLPPPGTRCQHRSAADLGGRPPSPSPPPHHHQRRPGGAAPRQAPNEFL